MADHSLRTKIDILWQRCGQVHFLTGNLFIV